MGDTGAGLSEIYQANQRIGLSAEKIAALNIQARERIAAEQAKKAAKKEAKGGRKMKVGREELGKRELNPSGPSGGMEEKGKEGNAGSGRWVLGKVFGRMNREGRDGDVVR
ncbi:MAG: hypothetical protein MMC33_003289 [Icmadophila ericetorum]|nr:hypothetical protein [Icmadophila ericetorum]